MAGQATLSNNNQRRFRLLALLLGLTVGLAVAVGVLRYYKAQQAPHFFGSYVLDGFEAHPYLGYAPKAGTMLNVCKIAGIDTLYCAQYVIDELGRRQMPQADTATGHVLLFGCSYTYGEGVNNEATFAYLLAEAKPNYQVYNYAYSGYGPQQLLAKLQYGQLTQEVPQPNGYLMYMLLPEHVSRAAGAPYYVQGWGSSSPHYALQNDSLVYYANHLAWRPVYTTWQRLLGWSGLGSVVTPVPKTYTAEEVALTIAILKNAETEYLALYPEGEFIVALPPVISAEANFKQLAAALNGAGIHVWDMHTSFPLQPPFAIPADGHPSAQGHQELAKVLAAFIN